MSNKNPSNKFQIGNDYGKLTKGIEKRQHFDSISTFTRVTKILDKIGDDLIFDWISKLDSPQQKLFFTTKLMELKNSTEQKQLEHENRKELLRLTQAPQDKEGDYYIQFEEEVDVEGFEPVEVVKEDEKTKKV